jgi:hypothetical protein
MESNVAGLFLDGLPGRIFLIPKETNRQKTVYVI